MADTKVAEVEPKASKALAEVDESGDPVRSLDKNIPSVLEESKRLFSQGKRQYLVKDFQASTDSLSECCSGFAKHYGDMAVECAEPLLLYAQSLLELARIESRVIDNGLEGVPVGEDCDNSQVEDPEKCTDEERKEVKKVVGEALEENFTELEVLSTKKAESEEPVSAEQDESADEKPENDKDKDMETEETEEDADEDDEQEDAEVESCEEAIEGMKVEEPAKPSTDQPDEADEDGNMTNIQLAWENADLAKTIYLKRLETVSEGNDEIEMKLCEALAILGEIAIEDDNFSSAVDDLRDCLERRVKKLSADSRTVAGTYYQLGVALSHDCKYDEAIENFKKSIDVLSQRVQNLKDGKISHDLGSHVEESYSKEKEIEEINILIPDINLKIEETKDLQAEDKDEPVEMEEVVADKENVEPQANGPTSDINHLVKKRKISDDGVVSEGPTKLEDVSKKPHIEKEENVLENK